MRKSSEIEVNVSKPSDGRIELSFTNSLAKISTNAKDSELSEYKDFAVWFMLPIAMRTGQTLIIKGSGSATTLKNAEHMSRVWSSWLPNHFRPIKVAFSDGTIEPQTRNLNDKALMFFSGGVDSTGALLRRVETNFQQDLLTVHGMDYKLSDTERFEDFIHKTNVLPAKLGARRIFVKTDLVNLYKAFGVNLPYHHISHIFTLAGSAFLFSDYSEYLIAADQRLDHQYMRGPYGSNTVTNRFFHDGFRQMITLDDDLTRSDKLLFILNNRYATDGLSICGDYKFRPNNCGVCPKCIMAKILFLARTGKVPTVFLNDQISNDWYKKFDFTNIQKRVHLSDAIYTALMHDNIDLIPNYETVDRLYRENAPNYGHKKKSAQSLPLGLISKLRRSVKRRLANA